ncbi:uncharacterized protein LOC112501002 [Cynara cardunculus var. scolymus]|uniref:DUF674 domain-containing protein n=1 Tax=Cynara cardunculus var. scolymus TaxID=59895 RepID=A0A103Y349_CYNCS|nr:uncharacterized protein LOC112501002 [Cynara cardunculus var. scolymus]XP_024960396.1 uncharacterized protein LOC112501002 [Cynara cardunculus var. scolymus]KVI01664.1 Protein of unknown function DUF674 [Cynara cardunculus var. scolymus]
MGESSAQNLCLKILVAKDENKVIMAESDKDFIEVLFSFMVMPIASAIRCTRNCLSGGIGCLSNLYGSVENLDMNLLEDERFQDVLLNPRSAAEIYCKNLEMNLIERSCYDFYVCHNNECKVISYYKLGKCRCGEAWKHRLEIAPGSRFFPEVEGGFLKSTVRFIITDDFKVMPVATMADLTLLSELGKYAKVEERTIKIGRDEVLNLLKRSLISKTPLSETFLKPSIDKSNIEHLNMKYRPGGMNPGLKVTDFWNGKPRICLKLFFDKVNDIVLYAVVEEDFVNMLCAFLAFPLGYIFNQFPCLSFEGCMGNLHKSIQGADINLFSHEERKEMLVNPKLSPGLAYTSNLIDIEEATVPSYSTFSPLLEAKYKILRSNPNLGNQKVFDGFVKGPATFLVMDNLEVKPLSPISVKLLIDKLMVPLSDIGEQAVILDKNKAMRLLAASLASKHALTSTFLHKETNLDCFDFLRVMWGGKRFGSKHY